MNAFVKGITKSNPLDDLASAWLKAKEDEQAAKDRRTAIESQIIEQVGAKEEGTTTAKGVTYKVKTVGGLNHKLDDEAIKNDWQAIPAELQQCFKFKCQLDKRLFRSVESLRDDLIPIAAKYITSTPAKTAIKIEEIK